jgi:AbrB family looped-hinge helix DNA binding protein
VLSTKISSGGRVVIPAALRRKFGIAVGDTVVFSDGEFGPMLRPHRAVVRDIQAIAAGTQRPEVEVATAVQGLPCDKPVEPRP